LKKKWKASSRWKVRDFYGIRDVQTDDIIKLSRQSDVFTLALVLPKKFRSSRFSTVLTIDY
jgi:hypothetical protein